MRGHFLEGCLHTLLQVHCADRWIVSVESAVAHSAAISLAGLAAGFVPPLFSTQKERGIRVWGRGKGEKRVGGVKGEGGEEGRGVKGEGRRG